MRRINDSPVDFRVATVNPHTTYWNHAKLSLKETSLTLAIDDLCYGCLEQTHAGWENNEEAYGIAPAWEKAKKSDIAVIAEREIADSGWLPAPFKRAA